MEDSKKYILPQKKYADMIVHFFDKNLENCCIEDTYVPEISLKITMSSEIDLEPIILDFQKQGLRVQYDYEEDLDKQTVIIDGKSLSEHKVDINKIATENIPQLEELTIQNLEMDNLKGIVGLFVLTGVSGKLREEIPYDEKVYR